jgi:Glycosyl transferase family 2
VALSLQAPELRRQSTYYTGLSMRKPNVEPLVTTLPIAECEVCVIVPVRDEAELLNDCLSALCHQVDGQRQRLNPRQYEVIVLANNCQDDSAAIARRFAQQHPEFKLHVVERTLGPADAYIGRVRQLLMDEAYWRLASLNRKRGIIASTDGDTRVAPNWIWAIQTEIRRGADVVGGQIMTDRSSLAQLDAPVRWRHWRSLYYHHLKTKLEAYIDAEPFDHWPRHQHHYGASLAVTAEMYQKAGGMPAVRTPEDVAFYQKLVRLNAQFRHSPQVRVTTSARAIGRTDIGFANQLAQWAAMGQQALLVESCKALETRFRARFHIRQLWQRVLAGYQIQLTDVGLVANCLEISELWLLDELKQVRTFGFLAERIEQQQHCEGRWAQRWGLVEMEAAIASLRRRTYWLSKMRSSRDFEQQAPSVLAEYRSEHRSEYRAESGGLPAWL